MTKLEMMQLSQGLSNLYTGLETDLIANIAGYLAAGNIDSPTAQWKIQMLAQLGALDKANIKTIAEYAGIAPDMLTEALETAALTAIEEIEPGFRNLVQDGIINGSEVPIENTMARSIESYNKQAKQSLNMVNTVMRYKAKSAAQKIINDTAELAEKQSFLDMLNKATGKAVTGAESRQAAMRQCVKEMSEKGIPAFVDKRGREWSPEAYINMDIRTTVSNVAHQAQFDRMEDYDLDLIEVSSHAGARPKCAEDQGKIFNRKNKDGYTTDLHGRKIRYYSWKRSSYGEPDGLLGINCGHHIYPFIPGVSYQTYFPYDEYDNQEQYRKTQNQRELERRLRKSKRECMILEKTGDTEGLQKAKEMLKTRQQALKQYCADNDLKYKPDRTAVVDYKKSVAGFTPTNKKNRIAEIKANAVDKSGGSGIIKESSKKPITAITDKSIAKVQNVNITGYTDEQCKFIQSQHQELLKYSRDNNENKEVAFVFDSNLSNRKEFTGSDDKLDFGSSLYGKDLFVMHNHPRNSSYSATDMIFLMQNNNLKSFSIVKNNGTVEVLTKSNKFDSSILRKDFERIIKKTVKSESTSEYDKAVKKLLEKHSQEGGMFEWIK